MLYLDWRPIVIEASIPRILKSERLSIEDEKTYDLIVDVCSKKFPKHPNYPIFLRRNFTFIEYCLRTDGIFLFYFERTALDKQNYSDTELAQFASYFLKVIFGHTHTFDDCPIDVSRKTRKHPTEYKLISNFPVLIGVEEKNGIRVHTDAPVAKNSKRWANNIDTLENLIRDEKLRIITCYQVLELDGSAAIEYKPTQELAILKLKRQFSSMFDLTLARINEISHQRERISILGLLIALCCILVLANIVGVTQNESFPDDYNPIFLPVTIFLGISALAALLGRIFQFFGVQKLVNDKFKDLFDDQSYAEFYIKLKHAKGKNFEKFIFSGGLMNKVVLGITIALFLTWIAGEYLTEVYMAMGLPVVSQKEMWNLKEDFYFSSQGKLFINYSILLLLSFLFLPKLRRYRRYKLVAWKRCYGYMISGSCFLRVLHKIINPNEPLPNNGYIGAIELSRFHMNGERMKNISEWALYLVLSVVPTYQIITSQ